MITKEKAEKIIALAEGMTHAEWSRINHIVVTGFETQEAKLTFGRCICFSRRRVKIESC